MKRRVPLDIEFLLESLTGTPINAHQKINEDPDNVEGENGEDDINYSEGDNVAFFCASEYSLIGPGQTHSDLMRGIRHIRRNNLRNLDILDDEGIIVANEQEMFRDIFDENGRLFKYLRELDKGNAAGNYRNDIEGFLVGRLWVNKRVISFWNSQEDVIDNWDAVENMFLEHGNRIGSLRAYKVDWVERYDNGIPMTPADSISSSVKRNKLDKSVDYENEPSVDDKGQMNFFAKLFRNPILLDKLSDAQLKQIRDKVHVMDPALKAQIMKANHGAIVNKAAEIADKLGMSVAEFHSLWSMDETVNESPDSFVMNRKQRAMFAATGHHKPEDLSKISYYDHDDAIAFLIDVSANITIYNPPEIGESPRLTHPDMGSMVMGYVAYPNDYDKLPVGKLQGFYIDLKQDVEPPSGPDPGPVAVLQARSVPELVKKLQVLSHNLPVDGDVPRRDTKFIQGRIWMKSKAISFWGAKDTTLKHFDKINELLVGLKLNKSKMVYEFTDSGHLYTYDELTGKSVELRSKEEMDRLMAIQHLSPTAKKKLAMMQGNLKQKGNVGWDFQAQKHAAMPALEESPDRVDVQVSNHKELEDVGLDPRKMNGAHWKDDDAITFILDATDKRGLWIAADQVVIGVEQYAHRPNHAALLRQIVYFRQYPSEFEIKTFGSQSVLVSKPNANRLKVWIVKGGVHGVDFSGKEDFSAYLAMADWSKNVERKTLPGNLILGRYWRNTKVISFWQKKSFVLKNFSLVEDFLKEFSVSPEQAAYEFIDISKVFPYTELFEEDDEKFKRGSEEMNDLIKKQHTDPSAKKKLKDMGYYDTAIGKKELGGFDTMAHKHAAMPALQELVKQINTAK